MIKDELQAALDKIPYMPNPVTPEWLEAAYKAGMIKMSDLVDGTEYYGDCRNASKAKWSAKDQKFYYVRNKFGSTFTEDINHPEKDNGYDLFIPVGTVDD